MAIARIRAALGPEGTPNFSTLQLSDLAGAVVRADADGVLQTVTIGTSLSYSAPTLNTIQGIRTTDSPTFAGLTLTGLSGVLKAAAGVVSGSATLGDLGNLAADKTFNNGDNSISFNFIAPSGAPTYDGAFEIQASGAFVGDLLHVHQHTGNPGATDLCHFEAEDADVLVLHLSHSGGSGKCLSIDAGAGETASVTAAGAAVLSSLTLVNSVTEFSTDGTLGDNSDTAVPTEKAVKTYVGVVGHDAVTLGTANGLSLVDQELSLPTTATPQFAGLGIATGSPLGLLHIGDGTENNSVDVACLVSRALSSGSGNAHGFSDSSNVSRAGGIGYCAFDGRFKVTGAENFDHIVSFQAAPTYSSAGALSDCYGLYVADPTKTAGTITNNYGIYVEEPTAGSTNYSIYSAGGLNVFGGSLDVLGRIGIGAAASGLYKLEITESARNTMPVSVRYNNTASNAGINLVSTDTTASALCVYRYSLVRENGTSSAAGGFICGKEELWTDVPATRKSYFAFYTASPGYTEKVRIDSRGNTGFGTTSPQEDVHAADTVRADTAFNLNGTDGVTQAAAAGTVCDVTALAGGIATAQTQITYAANGTYNFDATSGNVDSITITNGRITAITTAA